MPAKWQQSDAQTIVLWGLMFYLTSNCSKIILPVSLQKHWQTSALAGNLRIQLILFQYGDHIWYLVLYILYISSPWLWLISVLHACTFFHYFLNSVSLEHSFSHSKSVNLKQIKPQPDWYSAWLKSQPSLWSATSSNIVAVGPPLLPPTAAIFEPVPLQRGGCGSNMHLLQTQPYDLTPNSMLNHFDLSEFSAQFVWGDDSIWGVATHLRQHASPTRKLHGNW